jgi:diguanylate cyclase (GGDEF)-like protein/PAS domain S-box-containing protein/putative nucleotidyltransferase with HDIG domain
LKCKLIQQMDGKRIMDYHYYNQLFMEAPSGYAVHKKVPECGDLCFDYEFIDVNQTFENITGLKRQDVIGQKIRHILPEWESISFDWIGLYHEIIMLGTGIEAEIYSEPLKKWFRVNAFSLKNDYFVTQFTGITKSKSQINESEREIQLFHNVIDGANVGTWEWNVQTGEQVINERWAGILGYTIDELSPISIEIWKKLTHHEDLAAAENRLDVLFAKEIKHYSLEFRMKHKEGHWVWIESNGIVNSWTSEGKPLLVSGSHLDITKRKLAEEALKDNERRLAASQEIASVGNWELNLDTKEIWASEEAFKIYGIERTSCYLALNDVQARVAAAYRTLMDDALINLISRNEKYDIEFKIMNGITGKEIYVHSRAILYQDEKGKPLKVIGTIQDITEAKLRQEELIYMGYHDQLTGLYNRRFFNEELARLDTGRNLPLTIVQCDVNGLKLVNDSFGHDLGDELLKRVAKNIRAGCRADDIIARYGGDEFALILPKTDITKAEKVLKRIKGLISGARVGAFEVSVSFGFETKNHEDEDINVISKNAEDHMYRHKLYESKSARSKTIDLIINTLYEKNNREMLHSKRVSVLCESLANRLNIGKDEANQIKIAGLMHDIGKIGIDEKILNKPEKLTESEWLEIKKHSEIGYRILSAVGEFSEIAEFVLQHQERWDGSGYPKGLSGEEIALEARIISISDAYDAMTRERAYGKALSKGEALEEIRRCAGTQFDPRLAKLFIEMLH